MDWSTPGLPVHHQLPEFTHTQVHWVGDANSSLEKCKSKQRGTTPLRMAIIKKSTNTKHWRGSEDKGHLRHYWRECKGTWPLWRTLWKFLQKLKRATIWSSNLTSGHTGKQHYNLKTYMHANVHSSTVNNSQDMEATWMSTDRWMDKDVVCMRTRAHAHTHTKEYYSAIKKKEIMPCVATQT